MDNEMKLMYMNIDDVIPYENNPRNNDEAVQYVANSIKEFGFKVPIVIDKDNIIVTGHTRLKAAKQLKLDKVPCLKADDLTEEQIKAFRLADNKVSEIASWDLDKLNLEMDDIELNMSDFGFDMEIEELEPSFDELERENEDDEKVIIKVTFDTYKDYQKAEDELRKLVDNANATMVVGSI